MAGPEFEIEEGGITKYYFLRRKKDGRGFIYQRFYDPNLDAFDEAVSPEDIDPITKEEEEAVKRAIQEILGDAIY